MIDENDDDVDDTVVIDREPTVVPERDEDRTIAIPRTRQAPVEPEPVSESEPDDADDDDHTIALPRTTPKRKTDDEVMRLLPPRESRARAAVGPRAVASYPARTVGPAPKGVVADTVLRERGPGNSRALPSVARVSRRAGIRALVLFAAACVVSVVGIVVVVVWFVRG